MIPCCISCFIGKIINTFDKKHEAKKTSWDFPTINNTNCTKLQNFLAQTKDESKWQNSFGWDLSLTSSIFNWLDIDMDFGIESDESDHDSDSNKNNKNK